MQEKSTQALVIRLVEAERSPQSTPHTLGCTPVDATVRFVHLAAPPETQQVLRAVKRGLRTSTGLLYFDVCYQSDY